MLPDPATIGPRMEGKTCAGLWVTGTGKDGRPRRAYLYHVSDNADTMRDYDAQCVVWQTAVNPVVALELLAAGHGARVVHPFADAGFVDALATERGGAGPTSRTRAMGELFGDLLPRATITRVGKATFDGALWGPASQEFARSWDGAGVDPALVDVEGLRAQWARAGGPDARTYPLLQDLWARTTAPTPRTQQQPPAPLTPRAASGR